MVHEGAVTGRRTEGGGLKKAKNKGGGKNTVARREPEIRERTEMCEKEGKMSRKEREYGKFEGRRGKRNNRSGEKRKTREDRYVNRMCCTYGGGDKRGKETGG